MCMKWRDVKERLDKVLDDEEYVWFVDVLMEEGSEGLGWDRTSLDIGGIVVGRAERTVHNDRLQAQ